MRDSPSAPGCAIMSGMSTEDDDAKLFRDAIGPVREIKMPKAAPTPRRPKPRARMAEQDEAQALAEFRLGLHEEMLLPGDVLSYRGDRVSPHVWSLLKKGEYSAQEELDLHGLPLRDAETVLRSFLRDALKHGVGSVRIIHGKGSGSDGAPLIKNLVDRHLRHRKEVVAFHSAAARQGGTGAVIVLLVR